MENAEILTGYIVHSAKRAAP